MFDFVEVFIVSFLLEIVGFVCECDWCMLFECFDLCLVVGEML